MQDRLPGEKSPDAGELSLPTKIEVQAWLLEKLADELQISAAEIDPNVPFEAHGMSSMVAVSISGELEAWLGRKLPPVLLWEYPTVSALAAHLSGDAVVDTPEAALRESTHDAIAIVGMGCRFPGADGPEAFWALLAAGRDAVREVPATRWDVEAYYEAGQPRAGKMYTKRAGLVDGIESFDAGFFGIAPREATQMDPQQRMVLETTWEALEHAGIAPDALAGTRTGVFLGISSSDYSQRQFATPEAVDAYVGTGSAHSIAANRVSYVLDLRGPSLAIDTACSSSLVALHLAAQALKRGECSLALAGGVNALLSPEVSVLFSQARMMAADGACKTFDAAADGYVRGEGCGVVVLKRLGDAQADGDAILAVLRGSAVNQDGRTNGLTAPNGLAQQAALRAALADAGLAPSDIDYVEAHGTGTPLGDPIEVEALRAVLCPGRDAAHPLVLGSAKTNVGHLEAAAGMVGLIKTLLSLQNAMIPAHLHFKNLNPHIALGNAPIKIAAEARAWPRGARVRRAGVSSFGFGGTNAHVIVEEAPAHVARPATTPPRATELFVLSAQNDAALRALAARHDEALLHEDLALIDVCATMAQGRAALKERAAFVVASRADLAGQLSGFAHGATAISGTRENVVPRVAWLFTGQGAQYAGMGRALYDTEPEFCAAMDRCAAVLDPLLGTSLMAMLWGEDDAALNQTQNTQPAMFAIEWALASLWRAWGLEPAVVLGHSVGEYAAACVAGAMTLEDGARLIAERAKRMAALPVGGSMCAVRAPRDVVQAALSANELVAIGACNGPRNTVISGAVEAVAQVQAHFVAQGVQCTTLAVSHAFHSSLMDPMLDGFAEVARGVAYTPLQIPLASALTGTLLPVGHTMGGEHWRAHAREAVQFEAAIRAAHTHGATAFLEIGPAPVLCGMGAQCLPEVEGIHWLASLKKNVCAHATMLAALGRLYTLGASPIWQAIYGERGAKRVALPTCAWQRERYWLEAKPRANSIVDGGNTSHFYQLGWENIPAPGEIVSPRAASWVIFAGCDTAPEQLASALRARGQRAVMVRDADIAEPHGDALISTPLRNANDYADALRRALPEGAPSLAGVIFAEALDFAEDGDDSAARALHAVLESAVFCAQATLLIAGDAPPREQGEQSKLNILTRGAQAARAGETGAVFTAALFGFARAFASEQPRHWGAAIDLGASESPGDLGLVVKTLLARSAEDLLAVREGRLFAQRLARVEAASTPFFVRDEGAYLITGGLGGLGLETARWLAVRGARKLLLLGRSAFSTRAQAVRSIEALGASVTYVAVDTADARALSIALADYEREHGAIIGVFHAAGVGRDNMVPQLDAATLRDVFLAKAGGAWTLHRYFAAKPLDCFVLFSSAASMLGSPGQTAYAYANAVLDALATMRAAHGLPALAIQWGPWAEVGMAVAAAGFTERLAQRGIHAFSPAQGMNLFANALCARVPVLGAVMIDWEQMNRTTASARRPLFAGLFPAPLPVEAVASAAVEVPKNFAAPIVPLRVTMSLIGAQLLAARGEERVARVQAYLTQQVAAVLMVPVAQVGAERPFNELGMDSIMLMELINAVERDLRLKLYPNEVIDRPNVADLARYVAGELRAPEEIIAPEPLGAEKPQAPGRLRVTQKRDVFKLPKPAQRNASMVFVLSGPRVGSTLLRVMLAGHPRLFVPPELHLLPFHTMGERARQLEGGYLSEGLQRAYMDLLGGGAAVAKAHIDALIARDATIQEVYAELQALCAPCILVDKSPSYASSLDILEHAEDLVEGARYIHLTRHPYSVIESFLRNRFDKFVYGGDPDPVALAEEVWATTSSNVLDFFEAIDGDRSFALHYEDLVGHTEKTMRAMCKFLGVPYDPAVTQPYEGERMTDGIHEKSFSIGDPNFLTHKKIEPKLGEAWRKIRLGRRLGSFARRIAHELHYDLPHEGFASGDTSAAPQQVVPIKPSGSRVPLYCVAPAGGIVFPYFSLRDWLDPEQPLYGLQDPSLDDSRDFITEVPTLAAEHIAAVRSVQPEGPYYLCGWSFGGTVAYEMACQLVRDGHEVAFLGIIDSEAALPAGKQGKTLARTLEKIGPRIRTVVRVAGYCGPYIRDGLYLLASAGRRKKTAGTASPSLMEYFRWAWTDAVRHHLLQRANVADLVKRDSRLMLVRQPKTRRVLQVLRSNIQALRGYTPQPYAGTFTLFRASDQATMREHHADATLGWGKLATGDLRVVEVPGNHVVLMIKPYIEDFSAALNTALRDAQAAQAVPELATLPLKDPVESGA